MGPFVATTAEPLDPRGQRYAGNSRPVSTALKVRCKVNPENHRPTLLAETFTRKCHSDESQQPACTMMVYGARRVQDAILPACRAILPACHAVRMVVSGPAGPARLESLSMLGECRQALHF